MFIYMVNSSSLFLASVIVAAAATSKLNGKLNGNLISTANVANVAPQMRLFDESSERIFKVGNADNLSSELQSMGTGFVVDTDGWIATAFHVISDTLSTTQKRNPNVYVMQNEKRYEAFVWAVDPLNDVAILKVGFRLRRPWPLRSSAPSGGSTVLLVGFPHGLGLSVVSGNLQAIANSSSLRGSELSQSYQLTASAAPGMSGGPVMDSQGSVIGMTSAVHLGKGDVTWARQSKVIISLLKSAKNQKNRPTQEDVSKQIRVALTAAQSAQKALLNRMLNQRTLFHGWLLPSSIAESEEAECGESFAAIGKGVQQAEIPYRTCRDRLSFGGTESADATASFELNYGVIPLQDNVFKTSNLSLTRASGRVREFTSRNVGPYVCRNNLHAALNGESFLVTLCAREHFSPKDFFDTEARAASLDFSREPIVANMKLWTYSRESSQALISKFLLSLERSPKTDLEKSP